MSQSKGQRKEFERFPKYKQMYLNAFRKMIEARAKKGLKNWNTPEEVMAWWLKEEPQIDGQMGSEVTE